MATQTGKSSENGKPKTVKLPRGMRGVGAEDVHSFREGPVSRILGKLIK